VSTELL